MSYDEDQAGRASSGKPLGTETLDQVVILSSYFPTIFGIIALATAKEHLGNDPNEVLLDESGTCGGLAGIVCIGYSIFFCFGVSKRNPDLCKVTMMVRLALGVLFVIVGAFFAVKSDLPRCAIFISFAAFAMPEAYLLFTYGAALQKDSESGLVGQLGQIALMPPTSQMQQGYGQPPQSGQGYGGPAQGYGGPPQSGQGYGGGAPQGDPYGAPPGSGFGMGPPGSGQYNAPPPQQQYYGGAGVQQY